MLQLSSDGVSWQQVNSVLYGSTGTTVSGLSPDTAYRFRILGRSEDFAPVDVISQYQTNVVSATTAAGSSAPDTVSVTALPITADYAGPGGHPQDGYFDFHRSGDPSSALTATVDYTGTAVAGTDYSTLPPQVNFGAGRRMLSYPSRPPTRRRISAQ